MSQSPQENPLTESPAELREHLLKTDPEYKQLHRELQQLEQKQNKLREWIAKASSTPRTISQLAAQMGISRPRICYLEKRALVKCRREYLNRQNPTEP